MRTTPTTSLALAALATLGALAATGCTRYARIAHTNAPGTIDIATPPPREDGSPTLYVLPEDPGVQGLWVFLHPYVAGGLGRRGGAGYELGLDVALTRNLDANRRRDSFGVAAGMGFVQLRDDADGTGTDASLGPLSLEASYTRLLFRIGIGPVVYLDEKDAGVQLTARGPLVHGRLRYVNETGWEAYVGFDIPYLLAFNWSR